MISIQKGNDTIPITSRRLGSWQVSICRCPLPPEQLANRYDAIATDWERPAKRYQLQRAYRLPLLAGWGSTAFWARRPY